MSPWEGFLAEKSLLLTDRGFLPFGSPLATLWWGCGQGGGGGVRGGGVGIGGGGGGSLGLGDILTTY